MSQFAKDSELDSTLASGIQNSLGRTVSTSFDQRRTLDASGVVVDVSNTVTYTSDGTYGLADYYPLTFNATGILQVSIRDQLGCGDVIILDGSGNTVITAKPSAFSSRDTAITSTTVNASGSHYAYVQLKGRNGTKYRVGIDLYGG